MNTSGVYVLYSDSNVCLYVGCSRDMGYRVNTHRKQHKQFARAEYLPCSIREMFALEQKMRKSLIPTLNPVSKRRVACIWDGVEELFTGQDVRTALSEALQLKTQIQIANQAKVPSTTVSIVTKGAPITGKLLEWLGYEKTEPLYERRKP